MNALESGITIKHLKMVYAISKTASLTKAAELLNITQPALSNRLQNAESVLGLQLFFRRGRHLTLTNAGGVFLRCAEEVLHNIANTEAELSTIPDSAGQTIRLGMPPQAAYGWIPEAMKTLEREHAGVDLEIVSQSDDAPWEALQSGAISAALVSSPGRVAGLDSKRFRAVHLLRDEFVALVPLEHPMARRPYVEASEFARETYITHIAVPEKKQRVFTLFPAEQLLPGKSGSGRLYRRDSAAGRRRGRLHHCDEMGVRDKYAPRWSKARSNHPVRLVPELVCGTGSGPAHALPCGPCTEHDQWILPRLKRVARKEADRCSPGIGHSADLWPVF